ncbi:hypothetical protein KIN20_007040 [Parelaphostrongylus tenuis]|uniref:Uncharacterized protein n=1 Tax=Parelaphostrongylus tenuis TaxID=148309 RepID=A0AAD5M2Q6_PARTN|nr:hypothetical protein KIN20_007040 [Parelaphostrongylus tenuis]
MKWFFYFLTGVSVVLENRPITGTTEEGDGSGERDPGEDILQDGIEIRVARLKREANSTVAGHVAEVQPEEIVCDEATHKEAGKDNKCVMKEIMFMFRVVQDYSYTVAKLSGEAAPVKTV